MDWQNLALNINDHCYRLAVFNRTTSRVDDFINGPAKDTQIIGTHSIEDFVSRANALEEQGIIYMGTGISGGEEGAGHYVKMVHNGIEYGDMQLICEAYQFMRECLSLDVDAIADIFSRWNEGKLNSYLIEITSHILRVKDSDVQPLVDKILDTTGQKGTGNGRPLIHWS